jgi:hypothetical protein
MYESYNKRVYEVKDNDTSSFDEAMKIIRSWNYDGGEIPIPLGKFYQVDVPRFDQVFPGYELKDLKEADREVKIREMLEKLI